MLSSLTNIINKEFFYDKIDEDLVIIRVKCTTKNKFITSKMFNLPDYNFMSVVYTSGENAYILMDKIAYKDFKQLKIDDEFACKKISSIEADKYGTLVQLFINAVANRYDEYNNITGSCYRIFHGTNKYLDAYQYKVKFVNDDLIFTCSSCRFVHEKKKTHKPMFELCSDEKTLRRVFDTEPSQKYYVKEQLGNYKASSPFINIKDGSGRAKEMHDMICKVNDIYAKYIRLNFVELDIEKKLTFSGNKIEDIVKKNINKYEFAFVDLVNDSQNEEYIKKIGYELEKQFNIKIKNLKKPNNKCLNIVLIRDKNYYEDNHLVDPHQYFKKDCVIQCLYTETLYCLFDDLKNKFSPTLMTILKELLIKADIVLNHKITIDNWSEYNFKNKWKFIRRNKAFENGDGNSAYEYYVIEINPDGSFITYKEVYNIFNLSKRSEYIDYFGKDFNAQLLVVDDEGNKNLITREDIVTIPKKVVLSNKISRSRDNMLENYAGICDVNYYKHNNNTYYNSGMNLESIIYTIRNASHFYRIEIKDESEDIVSKLLRLMSVSFVKYNNLTVLPYPIKYINEFIKINELKATN